MKQKLSSKELLQGLAHCDERVCLKAFAYWMEMWLTDNTSPPFPFSDMNNWRKDEALMAKVSAEKVEKYAPLGIVEVLGSRSGILEDRVRLLLDFTSEEKRSDFFIMFDGKRRGYLTVLFAVMALVNLKKFWSSGYKDPEQYQQYLLKMIKYQVQKVDNYDVVASRMDDCPELYSIISDDRFSIALYSAEKTTKSVVDVINRLLEKAAITKDALQKEALRSTVNAYYNYLNDLRQLSPSNFVEITELMDQSPYYKEFKNENLVAIQLLKAEVTIRDQRLNWVEYLNYVCNKDCPYSLSWKMEILNLLWNKEIGKKMDLSLLESLLTLAKATQNPTYIGYRTFLEKYLKRYPEKINEVLLNINSLIEAEFIQKKKYESRDVRKKGFDALHWKELPKTLQRLWFWSLKLELRDPVRWDPCRYHLLLIEWWAINPELGQIFKPLLKRNIKLPWNMNMDSLDVSWSEIQEIISSHKISLQKDVLDSARDFLDRLLREGIVSEKVSEGILRITPYYGNFDLTKAWNVQKKLRAKKLLQDERMRVKAEKDNAKIEQLLKRFG